MNLYAIRRRSIATAGELEAVAARSAAELERRADQVRKIRTYVLAEPDGRIGTICLYEATSPEAVYQHALAADLPADEVVQVTAIDVVRPDPAFAEDR